MARRVAVQASAVSNRALFANGTARIATVPEHVAVEAERPQA
jgi:hypothetical protein